MHPHEQELTIEKLKKYDGFENITDDDAAQIIVQIREFCLIIIDSEGHRKSE
jgi:hypothetical protein